MKISKIYLPILFFSCVAIGIVIGGFINYPSSKTTFAKNNYKTKLNRLLDFIDKEYVDNVKTDSIVDLTVTNILANLDPHSVYIPPSEQTAVAESMKGDFVGIGILQNFPFGKYLDFAQNWQDYHQKSLHQDSFHFLFASKPKRNVSAQYFEYFLLPEAFYS